jgi:hypothetical protein
LNLPMNAAALHPWIRPVSIAYIPGDLTPALEQAAEALLDWLEHAGCQVSRTPDNSTELIITTARFGEIVDRDEAMLFHAKRRFRLSRRPQVLTLVDVLEHEYQTWLVHFAELANEPESAALTHEYPGLGPRAVEVIAHQARRGGPELAFSRLAQAQVLSIRVLALRTQDGRPYRAMHFDMAGARPVTDATDLEAFAADAGARVLAAVCAVEVDQHTYLEQPVPAEVWDNLQGPDAMVRAGTLFTQYGFFTTPFYVERVLGYRGISDVISAQYSEGCYATFDLDIPGLLATATGSSRLVDKRAISRGDQAVVVGLRPGKDGAMVRPVEGMERVVPSVEAVEMMSICQAVPAHTRTNARGEAVRTPNIRALLHGHVGVAAYDPALVEAVGLDPLFYTQLVSCGTDALATGTSAAFARSEALADLDDPRQIVFLEQPGHGLMVVEKWPAADNDLAPFELIHRSLAEGHLQVSLDVPQGPITWERVVDDSGREWMRKASQLEQVY